MRRGSMLMRYGKNRLPAQSHVRQVNLLRLSAGRQMQAVYATILDEKKGDIMELREYQYLVNRTAKNLGFREGLIHAALGVTGESGEFADAVKRVAIYDGVPDRANMVEELGDLLWYIAYACEVLGEPLEIVARENIEKLRKRYPDVYSDFHAHARMDKI